MDYSILVHYDSTEIPKAVGDFGHYFNRISKMGDTIATTGRKVRIKGYKNAELYDFRWACKIIFPSFISFIN
jgi:hypothetical protein